ncbi:hypothetical protein ABRP55_20100 [Pectobacterium zantedeschiae]|uniref:hypothetical protein n=1 Tax=Pectobacterium zantedeschiae TaxID=2034769 RepID=UPI0032EFB6F4
MKINKKSFMAVVCLLFINNPTVYASDDLSKQLQGVRESICYNHPNKKLCIDGIATLMKAAKAAIDVDYACKNVVDKGGMKTGECDNAESAVNWIESN